MVCTMMRSHISRLKPIKIHYRNYKYFSEELFQNELSNSNLISSENDPDNMYLELVQNVCTILDKHAPLNPITGGVFYVR